MSASQNAAALPSRRDIRFWDRIAPKYAKSTVADQASYERKLRETAALLRPDMCVLEIGCGTGTTALHHAKHVNHIHATDLSSAMLDIARSKARDQNIGNVSFEQSSAENFLQKQGGYDMIMAHSLLHLLTDPIGMVRKLAENIAPGGYLVTSTICMSDGMKLFKLITKPGHALGLLPSINYLSQREMAQAMTSAGLEIHTRWQPGPRKALFLIGRKPS